MEFKKTNYVVLKEGSAKNSVIAQVRDLEEGNTEYRWKEFTNSEEAMSYLNKYYKGVTVLPWVSFSSGYKRIFGKISALFDELLEENKLSLLLLNSEKIVERIKLIGITIDEEVYKGYETVYAYNLHLLIKCEDKVYVSHQIIYNVPLHEKKSDENRIKKVVPLFQNVSYFDEEKQEFVVQVRDSEMTNNPFVAALNLMSGIGEETMKKFRENDEEDRIIADFLELINLPFILKHKSGLLLDLKKEYYKMYLAQQKTL